MRNLLRPCVIAILVVATGSCHQRASTLNPTDKAGNASPNVQASAPTTDAGEASVRVQDSAQAPEGALQSTDVQVYAVKGVVQELKADRRTVVIKHEPVPDFMPAMTMPFKARDAGELENVAPGDEVTFTLHVSEQDNWIGEVRKTGKIVPPNAPGSERVRIVKPLKMGDAVPDYAFTNELGESIRLEQFRGRVIAMTFIFTRCPVSSFCRRMSANFARASERLKAMKSAPKWHLLSISFDPEFDTPGTLKEYAERYNYDPQTWSFVTCRPDDLDTITARFGLVVRRNDADLDHNLRTVVIDPEGKLRKVFIGNEWTPDDLVRAIAMSSRAGSRGYRSRRAAEW